MFDLKIMAALAAIVVGFAGTAQAVTTYETCVVDGSYNLLDNVSGAADCEISSADQDYLNTDPLTVNESGGFFDIDTWAFIGKIGTGNLSDATYGDGAGQPDPGSYDISSLFSGLTGNALLVFKSASANAGTMSLVGYLFDVSDTASLSGTWTTPFECPPFESNKQECNGFPKDVSHISVYSTVAPVPLPAAGVLLIGALGGLGFAARRRKG